MLAVVPDQLPWEIDSTGDAHGRTVDVSLAVADATGEPFFTVRTVERTGERFGAAGITTDRASIASMAVLGLLLTRIPTAEPERMRTAMRTAARRAADLALAAAEWKPEPIVVDDVEYAAKVRRLPEGFAATVDLGPRVLALWGATPPFETRFRTEDLDV